MVRDDALDRRHRDQLALVHQVLEQLGVVDDLVVAAELRVLVAQGVEAVRAGGDDLLGRLGLPRLLGEVALVVHLLAERHVQRGDILHAELLEEGLVAEAAGGVTGALLVAAHDRELDARHVQQLREGLGGLLGAVFQGAGAADPVQVLDLGEVLDVLADDRHLEVDFLEPLQALLLGEAPGVALLLQVLEHRARLGRERALDHHLVAAHVDDVVDVLDVHRALLDTGTAGGAGPQHVRVDDAVLLGGADEGPLGLRQSGGRHRGELLLGRLLLALHGLAATREQVGRLGVGVVPQRHDQQLRGERLAGVPGRALRLAASALGAGGEVEQTLPGELLDLGDAEDVVVTGVGEVDRLAAGRHGLQAAEGRPAARLALEPDVRERQEAVPGHAHVGVERDHDHPDERGPDLDHRDQVDQVLQRADAQPLERQDQRVRGEVPGLVVLHVVQRALEAAQYVDREADGEDDVLDEVGLAGLGAREAGLAARPRRQVQQADHDEHRDAQDRHHTDELDVQLERQEVADERQHPVRLEELTEGLRQGRRERQEAHCHEPVGEADDAPPVHPGVAEELLHQRHAALVGVVGTGTGRDRLTEFEVPDELADGACEQRDADHGQDQRHDDRGELHLGAPRACEGSLRARLLSGNLSGPLRLPAILCRTVVSRAVICATEADLSNHPGTARRARGVIHQIS